MSGSGTSVEEIAHLAGHTFTAAAEMVHRRQLRPVLSVGAMAIVPGRRVEKSARVVTHFVTEDAQEARSAVTDRASDSEWANVAEPESRLRSSASDCHDRSHSAAVVGAPCPCAA